VPALLSDLNMLLLSGGLERTKSEYGTLLAAAGLRVGRVQLVAPPYGVIRGPRPDQPGRMTPLMPKIPCPPTALHAERAFLYPDRTVGRTEMSRAKSAGIWLYSPIRIGGAAIAPTTQAR
jgi:hypothetical protein